MPVRISTATPLKTSAPRVVNIVQSGARPGILDHTQPSRLLKEPGSTLSFASFDPLTACGPSEILDFRKLSLNDELYRPKRVVIETLPSGKTTWRFVPNARRDEGVEGEGTWPRVVQICGQLVLCSQEQWEIYKLDPSYDCCVKVYPAITVIKENQPSRPRSPLGKRHMGGPTSSPEVAPRKKVHYADSPESTPEEEGGDGDEEDEVEEMIIDDQNHHRNPNQQPPAARRAKGHKPYTPPSSNRNTCSRGSDRQPTGPLASPFKSKAQKTQSLPPENHKRKVDAFPESLRSDNDPHFDTMPDNPLRKTANYAPHGGKRTRTVSPATAQRELQAKRREREELKRQRWEEERRTRKQERENRFMKEIYADIPTESKWTIDGEDDEHMNPVQEGSNFPRPSSPSAVHDREIESEFEPHPETSPSSGDEERLRASAIAESRRKLAELEADRPLWEKAAQERIAREKAEERARSARTEERERGSAQREKDAWEKKRREKEDLEARRRYEFLQQEKEHRVRRERERRERDARWCAGPWSTARAIERFKETSDYFEMARFSDRDPLTIDVVPWPTLLHPDAFSLEDVDWDSVEQFFQILKRHVRTQEYLSLVEKSHRRFHPDRWRSRNLLKSVMDVAERNCMEVAATTVSQALTPIWQQARATGS